MYYYVFNKAIAACDHNNFGKIGKYCQVGENQTCSPSLIEMDNWSRLQNNNNLISMNGKLIIKKFAAVGSQCIIIPDSHIPTVGVPQFLSIMHINDRVGKIVVHEDAWVGAGSILMSRCDIGRGAVIGAGSVVTKAIPPYAVAVGTPARIIATRFKIDQILEHEAVLYMPQERMGKRELEELFSKYYEGLPSIGTSEISEDDRIKLSNARREFEIKDYSKL